MPAQACMRWRTVTGLSMRAKSFLLLSALLVVAMFAADAAAANRKAVRRRGDVVGGPQGAYPYLFKTVSAKNLLDVPSHHPYSILHHTKYKPDTVHIIAVRVEFKLDSSEVTTGNGHFVIGNEPTPTRGDREELAYYYPDKSGTTAYAYDGLPHDKAYFEAQLKFVQNYFATVSRGKLHIEYTVYPPQSGHGEVPEVDEKMTTYSPGAKKPKESWDEYYYRRTVALMEFLRDAIRTADTHASAPFASLRQDPVTGILYTRDPVDTTKERRAALLIVHAGASYWTDGGEAGYFGQDTPSDMIDAFVSREFFDYFKDTLQFDTLRMGPANELRYGILANSGRGPILLDEIMMVSETSNQDSLNWGIHGILVNQIARQLGIPDLHSNQSEVGSFCIMDIAGYSAGRGFIPPWPSAWVRAFMGWDMPVVAEIGQGASTYAVRALGAAHEGDTTVLLIPINDHEYYLVENRQRNLSIDTAVFNYDWSSDSERVFIDPFDQVNLAKNAVPAGVSKVLDSVRTYDVSIPASGVLIWHIDENLVRDRLEYNVLNSDSLYGAVKIVEADGIDDLGIMFMDLLFQPAFDYGGAEDVFPHTTIEKETGDVTVNSFGPFTRPSTQSNDGGHTYLSISVAATGRRPAGARATEMSALKGYYVTNTVDSVFQITIKRDDLVPGIAGWPKRALPCRFFEAVVCSVFFADTTKELAALDTAGRLYVWPAEGYGYNSFGSLTDSVIVLDLRGDSAMRYDTVVTQVTVDSADTAIQSRYAFSPVTFLRRIPNPVSFPTAIGGRLYVPSGAARIYVLNQVVSPDSSASALWDSIALPAAASSYVCNYAQDRWAVGCVDGSVVFGAGMSPSGTVAADSSRRSPVEALAVLDTSDARLAVVHHNGMLAVLGASSHTALASIRILGGIAPFTLVAGDLNRTDGDSAADIVVCDSRQGMWLFKSGDSLRVAPQWKNEPNDWASTYHYAEEGDDPDDRTLLPVNTSSPSLVDLDADGALDIVMGGTNGIYAFNHKGVFLTGWPAELDKRYWHQRGSVISTPAIGVSPDNKEPRIVFSSPTGENVTFAVAKIDSAPAGTGMIFYSYTNGSVDSIGGLSQALIDTLLVFGDSIILPYITPGGYIDAMDARGRRPDTTKMFSHVGTVRQSYWPLSTGGQVSTSPILCDIDNDGSVDVIALSNTGAAYRFELNPLILSDSLLWAQAGFDASRRFAYLGPPPAVSAPGPPAISYFYNYPNPTGGLDMTVFRYAFSAPATNVRLDVFTYTGYHVYSARSLPSLYPSSDEHQLPLDRFGPGVYRCRLEATVGGSKQVKYWKMAVVK